VVTTGAKPEAATVGAGDNGFRRAGLECELSEEPFYRPAIVVRLPSGKRVGNQQAFLAAWLEHEATGTQYRERGSWGGPG
jgi:hypothetical protein